MARKIIISCAVTGGSDTVGKHPAIPVTPEQIAKAATDARRAGAAVAHIHVRNPETGKPSMAFELYEEVVQRIRDSGSDVLVNLTTGAGGRFIPGADDPAVGGPGTTIKRPEERVVHVERLRPDICSLDVGTMNKGQHIFANTPGHLATMAEAIRRAGVKPELEVFDTGHVMLARHLIDQGVIATPAMFQICLGVPWGAPATPEAMIHMRDLLPPDAVWAAFGISRHQFPMVAQTVLLGGHVRVGLEDNLYISKGVLARDNAALVEKAVQIVTLLGDEPATPAEARDILGLEGGSAAAAAD